MTGHAGLWELREGLGNVSISLFFFQAGHDTLVVIHGFVKKTRKTPKRELSLAIKKKSEYEHRAEKG